MSLAQFLAQSKVHKVYVSDDERKRQEAIRYFEESLKLDPENEKARNALQKLKFGNYQSVLLGEF